MKTKEIGSKFQFEIDGLNQLFREATDTLFRSRLFENEF